MSVIHDVHAEKIGDVWHVKFCLLHHGETRDPWSLFGQAAKKIEKILGVQFFRIPKEEFICSDRYTSFRYIPKSPEEEAFFIMKFPTIENMEIEI